MNDDTELKELGFESSAEFHKMVASVDLSSLAKIQDFKRWQNDDGTKAGLLKLPRTA
jgi:hypothetical protein